MAFAIPGGSPNETDYLVGELERYFTDLVTSTPVISTFTAAGAGSYLGVLTETASFWLQRYRDVQGGKTRSEAEFTVATFERGAGARWYIITWPGMTSPEKDTSGELATIYVIMTTIREEVRPMLRNIEVEFRPAVLGNHRVNRALATVNKTKLDNYRVLMLSLQRDVLILTRSRMKRAARRLNHLMNATIDEIDHWRAELARL